MKPNALNRLEKLERTQGVGDDGVKCIERVIVDPRQGQCELEFYRDALGSQWMREQEESSGQFRERVTMEAIAMARPQLARLVGESASAGNGEMQ